jgi:hypothetical protein
MTREGVRQMKLYTTRTATNARGLRAALAAPVIRIAPTTASHDATGLSFVGLVMTDQNTGGPPPREAAW